jgi:GTPase SAR1 family protein
MSARAAHKVMLLGEIGVGKSSLARRLVLDRFEADYKPTIGVEVYRYELPPAPPSNVAISLILWDTDGNFGDAIFRHVYLKEAAGAVIIGDQTRPDTLETMVRLGVGFAEARPGRPVHFIVNKADLDPGRSAPPWPDALASDGVPLTRTSAKTGAAVTEAFRATAMAIMRRG